MKLTILGGGGSRALILVKSLAAEAERLGINELVFMDTDSRKLKVFGEMVLKSAAILAPDLKVSYTTDAVTALKDASFVITTVRVGGDYSRVIDEGVALKYDVLGQETTGAGGFSMALRSIPVLAEYCSLIEKVAKPDVLVFNFTNPAGLVTQAMHDLGYNFVYGICDTPLGFMGQIARVLGRSPMDFELKVFGLNHLSYFTSVKLDGKEVIEDIIKNPRLYTETDMRYFEPELAGKLGMLLNEYLYYYYYREKSVENIKQSNKSRGAAVALINAIMLEELEKLDVGKDFTKMLEIYSKYNRIREMSYMTAESSVARDENSVQAFDLLSKDEGGYAAVALAFIRSKLTGAKGETVLCVPNNGAVDWLKATDIVEVSCYVDAQGAHPKKDGYNMPETVKQLISNVKFYERTAVSAILRKDKSMAVDALMMHPLVNSYSLAKTILDEYLAAYEEYTGGWR